MFPDLTIPSLPNIKHDTDMIYSINQMIFSHFVMEDTIQIIYVYQWKEQFLGNGKKFTLKKKQVFLFSFLIFSSFLLLFPHCQPVHLCFPLISVTLVFCWQLSLKYKSWYLSNTYATVDYIATIRCLFILFVCLLL